MMESLLHLSLYDFSLQYKVSNVLNAWSVSWLFSNNNEASFQLYMYASLLYCFWSTLAVVSLSWKISPAAAGCSVVAVCTAAGLIEWKTLESEKSDHSILNVTSFHLCS